MYKRHGIFTNMVAMVLAFTMSLCCCIVRTATSAADSSCVVGVVETISCCQKNTTWTQGQQSSEKDSENEPCCDDCGCTIKGTIFTQSWTPPVDLIGVDAPAPFYITSELLGVDRCVAQAIHDPPIFDFHILGNSGAPPMRGSLILQV